MRFGLYMGVATALISYGLDIRVRLPALAKSLRLVSAILLVVAGILSLEATINTTDNCLNSSKPIPDTSEFAIPPGAVAMSPNGEYSVLEVPENGTWSGRFLISRNGAEGSEQTTVVDLRQVAKGAPLRGLCWSPSSEEVALMYHIAEPGAVEKTIVYTLDRDSNFSSLMQLPAFIGGRYRNLEFSEGGKAVTVWAEQKQTNSPTKFLSAREPISTATPGP